MLQVPLDLFRRDGRVAAAAANVAVAELSVADRERIFTAAIRDRAGAALLAARLLAVTDDLLTVNRRTRDLLAARVSEGATPPVERDVAEVEVRRLEAERAHRAADTDAAVLALKAALGLSADAPLTLRDDLEQQVRKETTPIETTSIPLVEKRSDVREAAARVTAAEARAEQLRREARFDLSFYGSYMRMDASFPQRGLGPGGIPEPIHGVFHYAELGGMVMLPIFNRNQGTIAAAESERRAAELARQSRALVARAEAGAALIHAHHAIEAIDHARVARDLARRNVDVIRESYQLGRNTLFEVFVEQRRLVEVEMTYADTLAAAFQARTALIRATGATP
jgi:cobalt-zinc-cadmium efflux system outer membrane protein